MLVWQQRLCVGDIYNGQPEIAAGGAVGGREGVGTHAAHRRPPRRPHRTGRKSLRINFQLSIAARHPPRRLPKTTPQIHSVLGLVPRDRNPLHRQVCRPGLRYNMAQPEFSLNRLNAHKMVLAAVLLAAKYQDDFYYDNKAFQFAGGVNALHLHQLELELFQKLDYNLFVAEEHFQELQAKLYEVYAESEEPPL